MNGLRFALFLSLATAVHAGTNGFVVPAFRGGVAAQAGYWETFSTPVGAPGNPPDKAGATLDARLTQSSPTAFLTGSGNLYNLDNASSFTVAHAAPFTLGTVILQTRTLGTELAYTSVVLLYTNQTGSHSAPPTLRWELDRGVQPGLGATVATLWQWNLTSLGVSNYSISFQAAGPSTSFDSMTSTSQASSHLCSRISFP